MRKAKGKTYGGNRPTKRPKWKARYHREKKQGREYVLVPYEITVEAWTKLGAKKEVMLADRYAKPNNITIVGRVYKKRK